jgi:hypothetical protein
MELSQAPRAELKLPFLPAGSGYFWLCQSEKVGGYILEKRLVDVNDLLRYGPANTNGLVFQANQDDGSKVQKGRWCVWTVRVRSHYLVTTFFKTG